MVVKIGRGGSPVAEQNTLWAIDGCRMFVETEYHKHGSKA